MQELIIKNAIGLIFSGISLILGAKLNSLGKKMKQAHTEQDALKLGIQALLRDRIIQAYNHYSEKGFIPIYALENVEEMYTQYHNLGGNGVITELVDKIHKLPQRKDD